MAEDLKSKRRRKYTVESLKDAIRAVANGMSVRKASLTFRVPQMTIVRYEKSPTAQKIGRKTKLDTTEEALLVDPLIAFGNSGFPMNKHNLRSFVDEISFGKGTVRPVNLANDVIVSLKAKDTSRTLLP
ncbi:hypothetical protein RvY_16104 [Ramazzottius varieornatus]|uniref:HTH psq-type domain-containing protein n=1 Tax=Ramazzottius varieornatus TaxID=947166 RepID=A0A1D1W1S7_RAMVA|nr:hypothetical protein RvY_16104 [Ramazzottius varieornatus]